jgi:hypothetical protein
MTALERYLAGVKARAAAATYSDGLRLMNDESLSALVERIRRTLRGGLPDLLTSEKADIIQVIERHREVVRERNRLLAMVEAAQAKLDLCECITLDLKYRNDAEWVRINISGAVAGGRAELDRLAAEAAP